MEKNEKGLETSRRKQTFLQKSDETKFKIILVGDSGVGKTSLFMAFTDDDSEEQTKSSVTTVDFRLQPLQIQGQIIKLHIWDTAGQQRYRSIVESFFKGCQGAIIVFDLSRKQSFTHATNQWFKLCQNKLVQPQIILIGNKSDLTHAVTEQQVREWSLMNAISYFQSSVFKSQNIEEPFVTLSKKMLKRKNDQAKIQLMSQVRSNPKKAPETLKANLSTKVKTTKQKNCC